MIRAATLVVSSLALLLSGTPASAKSPDPQALFARERTAVGGDAWNRVAAVRTTGVLVLGGSPSTFSQLVDRRTGWSKATAVIGSLTDVSGFDGVSWDFEGGPVTVQTLPGLQADNVTQAYVARDGWWRHDDPATMVSLGTSGSEDGARVTPAGGSQIDVWFDRRTGLIDREVAHTDTGLSVTVLDDYRTVGDLVVSYHQVSTDPAGAVTAVISHDVVPLATIAQSELARPLPRSSGRVTSGSSAATAFRLSGTPGAIVVPLRVGRGSLPIIFDSGAGNYFTPAGAKQLGLGTSGGFSMEGVGNGSEHASLTNSLTLAIGAAQLVDQHAVVAPLPYALVHESAGLDLQGLVGSEFLQAFRTTFDFDTLRVRFEPFTVPAVNPPGAVVEPFLSDSAHAYVHASVDGVPGLFLLDTGDNGDITVFRRFASAHGLLRGTGVAYLAIGGIGGHVGYQRYRARTFSLGGATMHGPPVTVTDQSGGSFASRSIAGNIGLRVISRYRITFDFRNQTVTFVPRKTVDAPFLVDRAGLSLNQTDPAAFTVLSLVPGGPATAAGLRVGDRIVAIAGRNVAAGRLGINDIRSYQYGTKAFTVTVQAADGTQKTVSIEPRDLLPAAR
jgi:hypothetical protein